jgi:hypothetical protein
LWRLSDPLFSPVALALTAGLLGQMVHMSVDIFQSRPQVQLLWLVAALLVAMETTAANGADLNHAQTHLSNEPTRSLSQVRA